MPTNKNSCNDGPICRASRQLFDPDDAHVSITIAEFDILLVFRQNPGRIMPREQWLALTHAGMAGPLARSIDAHVYRKRQKIERNKKNRIPIEIIPLCSYLFTSEVEDEL
jgi:two-component system OmpR family response regulator